MRNRIFLALVSVAAAVSCAPLTYTLPVERMSPSSVKVDLFNTLPGVLVLDARDNDSVLMAALANGLAEGLEIDLGLDSGAVPVYTMRAEDISLQDSTSLPYLHALTGVDVLLIVDSLELGEFAVSWPEEEAYMQSRFMKQTKVQLPYSVRVRLFDSDSVAPAAVLSEADVLEWALLADAPITSLRAIEKVNSGLEEYFRSMGLTMVSGLTPKWETVNVTLYVYDDSEWTEACRLAYLFEWEKAMDIWMKYAGSPDVRKAACAAHNISVACEILELKDVAAEWRERSEELFNKK